MSLVRGSTRGVFAWSRPAGRPFMWGGGRGGRPRELGWARGAGTFSDVRTAQPLALTEAEPGAARSCGSVASTKLLVSPHSGDSGGDNSCSPSRLVHALGSVRGRGDPLSTPPFLTRAQLRKRLQAHGGRGGSQPELAAVVSSVRLRIVRPTSWCPRR